MNGFRLSRVFVVVVLTAAMVGCAGSRGGGCRSGGCHASSAGSVPPRRAEAYAHHEAETTHSHSQKNCPVTGEPLGSMGKPIAVTVHGETILVCCQGCVKAVKKDPEKYLAIMHGEQ